MHRLKKIKLKTINDKNESKIKNFVNAFCKQTYNLREMKLRFVIGHLNYFSFGIIL